MSPVTHMLEPPSTIFWVFNLVLCSVMEEESPWMPQTRGEHTTCVTLSMSDGRSGSCVSEESSS